ncbi:unknown protein [Cronobacter turicensis z3032]|uniref:Uncharacterized protein n=1 Tax=Cronobacter turicensis (strain DSM 18703 / CCUG 55852 / LMG 23827 / z3032) TaxID=693216 RepID=C9Y0W6_CROTZ|nr:unknown protein [Cronobacter turicensis z3032]
MQAKPFHGPYCGIFLRTTKILCLSRRAACLKINHREGMENVAQNVRM